MILLYFRHCWSMRIYFDLEDLYQVKNDKVQPNLFIKHLGIENIVEVSFKIKNSLNIYHINLFLSL